MERSFWLESLARAFAKHSVVWLSGVRRSGKTTLVRSLEGASYYDCELVRVRRALEDPEVFFRSQDTRTVVLDEVHRLQNPSEVLKIAADHFPKIRVVATGSSTLAARSKFKDTLTGRKRDVWLVPMIATDLEDFGDVESNMPTAGSMALAGKRGEAAGYQLDKRMLRGGLPPFFLSRALDDKDYEEWVDSYWAKDLSELFVVDKKTAFTKFVELVFVQSGGLFEAQAFAGPCEVSRPTIQHWLSILEITLLAVVLRPYHGAASTELKAQPKVYAFDTGFVCYFRGWDSLRADDKGILLEHLVLGEIAARTGTSRLHYWRDKQKHEVDFVLEVGRRRELLAIECKSSPAKFSPEALRAFRRVHPKGDNLVVTLHPTDHHRKTYGDVEVEFIPYASFGAALDRRLKK